MAGNTGSFTLWGANGLALTAEVAPFSDVGDFTLWGANGLALVAQVSPGGATGEFTFWGANGLALAADVVFGGQEPQSEFGTAEFTLNLSMVLQAEVVNFDLELQMLEYGMATMQLELLMYDPSFVNSNPLCWSVKVTLDGADISNTLIGTVQVDAEESLARTAVFTIKHTGTVLVSTWVGKPVTVDFQQIDPNNIPLVTVRVFTGIVDIPIFDPNRVLVVFHCIDNLNGVIGQQPRVALDQLIQGFWSPFVFEADANSLDYASAQLSTVPKALDMNPFQQLRVTAWAAKVIPDFVLSAASQVIDDSVSFEMPNRSELKNCINLEFQYRFPRLRARRTGVSWGMPALSSLVFLLDFTIPTKAMVEGCANGLGSGGWHLLSISYVEPPVTQVFGPGFWICSPAVAAALAWGVSIALARRWVQTVTEVYTMKVIAASSVAGVGEICEDQTVGMHVDESVFDFAGWEADLTRLPGPTYGGFVNGGSPPWPRAGIADSYSSDMTSYGQDFAYDMVDVPGVNRAAMDNAVQTVLNSAKVRILGSHRFGRLNCTAPLNPFLDLIHTVEVDTPKLSGKGKVASITYQMDIAAGQATMAVSIAISGTGFVGFQPQDPLVAPPLPPPPVYTPPISQSETTHFGSDVTSVFPQPEPNIAPIGYLGNRTHPGLGFDSSKRYVPEFRLQAPSIPDELTQPLELPQTLVQYAVVIPQDDLTLTG